MVALPLVSEVLRTPEECFFNLPDYPFAAHYTELGGLRIAHVDEGPRANEAVLMLHGNPTWSFFYRDLIKQLSPKIRCIAPDHIGMGLSEKPEDYNYSLETRVSDVEALVSSLGLTKVHLVVHDWGGAIGFGLATRAPDLIDRITILNTAAFVSNEIPFRISLCRLPWLGDWLVRGLNAPPRSPVAPAAFTARAVATI